MKGCGNEIICENNVLNTLGSMAGVQTTCCAGFLCNSGQCLKQSLFLLLVPLLSLFSLWDVFGSLEFLLCFIDIFCSKWSMFLFTRESWWCYFFYFLSTGFGKGKHCWLIEDHSLFIYSKLMMYFIHEGVDRVRYYFNYLSFLFVMSPPAGCPHWI